MSAHTSVAHAIYSWRWMATSLMCILAGSATACRPRPPANAKQAESIPIDFILLDQTDAAAVRARKTISEQVARGRLQWLWMVHLHVVRDQCKAYKGKGAFDSDWAMMEDAKRIESVPLILAVLLATDDRACLLRSADAIEKLTGYESWRLVFEEKRDRQRAVVAFCDWWMRTLQAAEH